MTNVQPSLPFPVLDPARVALVRVMHDRVAWLWTVLRRERMHGPSDSARRLAQAAIPPAWMAAQSYYGGSL